MQLRSNRVVRQRSTPDIFGVEQNSGRKCVYTPARNIPRISSGEGTLDINFYQLARENFESNVLSDKPITVETEKDNLYAGLVALTHAIENHLNEVLRAVQKNKGKS
jgi:hypothetical protein